jgi:hypothetical protein
MKDLIRLEIIHGQKIKYRCPECDHILSTGRKELACPGCKSRVRNPDAGGTRKYLSIARGPGVRGQKYIVWRDQVILRSGVRRGQPCPCCGEWIDGQYGQVELHHILDRAQFPKLVRAIDNVFVGCSRTDCGDALDAASTHRERLIKIREMGAQIIRSMPVRIEERPRNSDELTDWCLRMYDECKVPIK